MTLAEFLSRLSKVKEQGEGWTACCPAHDDQTPSLSIKRGDDGRILVKCFAGCTTELICAKLNLTLADLFSTPLNGADKRTTLATAFNWQKCVSDFGAVDAQALATSRGLSAEFVSWLHAQNVVGMRNGKVAFANHDSAGNVVSCHVRIDGGKWIFYPNGKRTAPLIFGDPKAAGFVLVFESQWDAFAIMDKLGWHKSDGLPDSAVFITRGAGNGKLIRGYVSPDAVIYAFKQNDVATSKKPIPAGAVWLSDVASNAGCQVLDAAIPAPHKDANDWTLAGASRTDLDAAMKSAKPVQPVTAALENKPDLDSDIHVSREIVRILLDQKLTQTEQRTQIANVVVSALNRRGRFYFHAERKDFDSALYFDGERKRLLRIRSDSFLAWLADWVAVNRADGLFKFITAQVETTALAGSQTVGITPDCFWASRAGAIYLSNGDGQLVKITAGKFELTNNGTDGVLFEEGNTLAAWTLCKPADPFVTCSLFSRANCVAGHGLDVLRLWLVSLPTIPASKPPLCLAGEIGSGKTRLAKGIAELYGLPPVIHKADDNGEDSFWASMDGGGLFVLDNCDTRNRWLPDAVANAATDGCSQRRKKYTDSERVTLRARAWLVLTTSNPTLASDSGLADRLLVVRMNRRADETSDSGLSDEIKANRDGGLSFITRTIATALADTKPTPGGLNQRHPDFAALAIRIGRALGRENESVTALQTAEADKSQFCVENDTIGAALVAYLSTVDSFTGTAAELRVRLIEADPELTDRLSTKRLGKRLAALWPHLEKVLQAKQQTGRSRVVTYTLKIRPSGECGEFQTNSP